MKKHYNPPLCVFRFFESEDVITASVQTDGYDVDLYWTGLPTTTDVFDQ